MKTFKRGLIAYSTTDKGKLHQCTVLSHHPEQQAVTVRIFGDDWILKESEVIPEQTPESDFPEWLKTFIGVVRSTKLKTSDMKPNKAEAARKSDLPYSRVLDLCNKLVQIGVNLTPKP